MLFFIFKENENVVVTCQAAEDLRKLEEWKNRKDKK